MTDVPLRFERASEERLARVINESNRRIHATYNHNARLILAVQLAVLGLNNTIARLDQGEIADYLRAHTKRLSDALNPNEPDDDDIDWLAIDDEDEDQPPPGYLGICPGCECKIYGTQSRVYIKDTAYHEGCHKRRGETAG